MADAFPLGFMSLQQGPSGEGPLLPGKLYMNEGKNVIAPQVLPPTIQCDRPLHSEEERGD